MPIALALATSLSYVARRVERPCTRQMLHISTLGALLLCFILVLGSSVNRFWVIQEMHAAEPLPICKLLQLIFLVLSYDMTFLSFIALGYYISPSRQMAGELPYRRDNENIRKEEMMVCVWYNAYTFNIHCQLLDGMLLFTRRFFFFFFMVS